MPRNAAAAALIALLTAWKTGALERPNHQRFENVTVAAVMNDKCMKHLWPDVVDPCNQMPGYHDVCQVRSGKFDSKYGGSCDQYCSSFDFVCSNGYAIEAKTAGCQMASASAYFTCEQQIPGSEAICVCRDPQDTFLWRGAEKSCGAGRALVRDEKTCGGYCQSQGLSCESAAKSPAGDCSDTQAFGCDASLAGSAAVCHCGGRFDRTGAHQWPDKLETCGASIALVAQGVLKAHNGTCDGYCQSLRRRVPGYDLFFSCYGAWPSDSRRGCRAYTELLRSSTTASANEGYHSCSKTMMGDAICACSFADL